MKTQRVPHQSFDITWQRLSLLFLLLPLYVGIAQCKLFGLTDRVLRFSTHWLAYSMLALVGGLLLLSIGLIVRQGRLNAGLASLALAVVAMFTVPSYKLALLLRIDNRPGISVAKLDHTLYGTDVYCNDVHLGQIPLHLSITDFLARVPLRSDPPERILALPPEHNHLPTPGAGWWMSQIPYDVFHGYRTHGFGGYTEGAPFDQAGYWWRFERHGIPALVENAGFGGVMAVDAADRPMQLSLWPSLRFPSLERHVELLLHTLRMNDYQPSREWMEHVQKYWDPLFPTLYERGATNPGIEQALRTIVQERYGIQDEMSQEEAGQAFERVLSHVEQTGWFVVPSAESMAIDLLGERASKAVEKAYHRLSHVPPQTRYVREMRGNGGNGFFGRGKSARIPPLEYAILQNPPTGLLNQIIYDEMPARWPAISLVACYSQPEAIKLVTRYLQRVKHAVGETAEWQKSSVMRAIPEIHNRKLDLFIYDFMRSNDVFSPTGPMLEFIESRMDATWTDGAQLYEWFIRRLPEREQIPYLTRLRSPHTGNYLRNVIRDDAEMRREAIANLEQHPNPDLDEFLIDMYERYCAPNVSADSTHSLLRAMLMCDTPKMHAYLEDMWKQGDETQMLLLGALNTLEPAIPQQASWLPSISELSTAKAQLQAMPVLVQIDTPKALSLLDHWSLAPAAEVRQAASEHLAALQEQTEQRQRLIAGTLHPSELSSAVPAYVWSGKEYVRE